MPRVYTVKKTRKDQGSCGKCGCAIKKGDPYRYWEFRYGGRRVRCMKPECSPKPSDLTQSEFLSQLYNLQETDFSSADTIEDLESMRDEVASELENLANECEEKRSNMPEGLQEGDTGNLLQERYDACNDAASELQGVDISYDGPEADEEEEAEEWEAPERDGDETDEEYKKRCEEDQEIWKSQHPEKSEEDKAAKEQECEDALQERIQEIAQELSDVLNNISCG